MTRCTAEAKGFRSPPGRGNTSRRSARVALPGILAAVIMAAVCTAEAQHSHEAAQEPGKPESAQTECPVMVQNKIDPSIYTDYQGKRVFFCCLNCKASFAKDPERYLSRLPQFAPVQTDANHEFSLMNLAEPTGILTLSMVGLTVCLGVLRRVRRLKPRLLLKLHKIVGVCALGAGAVHATIVLLIH